MKYRVEAIVRTLNTYYVEAENGDQALDMVWEVDEPHETEGLESDVSVHLDDDQEDEKAKT